MLGQGIVLYYTEYYTIRYYIHSYFRVYAYCATCVSNFSGGPRLMGFTTYPEIDFDENRG